MRYISQSVYSIKYWNIYIQILFRPHENDYGDAEMDFAEWNANPDNANKFIKVILSVMSTTGELVQ